MAHAPTICGVSIVMTSAGLFSRLRAPRPSLGGGGVQLSCWNLWASTSPGDCQPSPVGANPQGCSVPQPMSKREGGRGESSQPSWFSQQPFGPPELDPIVSECHSYSTAVKQSPLDRRQLLLREFSPPLPSSYICRHCGDHTTCCQSSSHEDIGVHQQKTSINSILLIRLFSFGNKKWNPHLFLKWLLLNVRLFVMGSVCLQTVGC